MTSSSARRISSVLIVGSSGTIGQHITSALAGSRKSFQRVAIFTSPSTVQNKRDFIAKLEKHDVEVIQGDLGSDADVKKAFEGMHVCEREGGEEENVLMKCMSKALMLSALGRGALHLQTRLVDLYAALPKLSSGYPRRFYPSGERTTMIHLYLRAYGVVPEYGTDIRYDPVTSPHGQSPQPIQHLSTY